MPSEFVYFFGQEEIDRIGEAHARAVDFIQTSGDAANDALAREKIARHILAAARAGEESMVRLANFAIGRYREQRRTERAIALSASDLAMMVGK